MIGHRHENELDCDERLPLHVWRDIADGRQAEIERPRFQVVPEPVERAGKNLHLHMWVLGPESVEGRHQRRDGKEDVHSEADAVLLAPFQRLGMSRKSPRTFDCGLGLTEQRPPVGRQGRPRRATGKELQSAGIPQGGSPNS